jgi:hypothetical protein
MIGTAEKPFTIKFLETESDVHLELTNATESALKSVEVLTVFLKDEETPGGGPSQAHIKFDALSQIRPKENVVVNHKTWINGKIVPAAHDQLQRLRIVAGAVRPYVLDISWQDTEGKSRFQRIPVGH